MGLVHIIHNLFNGLKHALFIIMNFLYCKDEEVMLTVRITAVLCGILSLIAWYIKLRSLLIIIVVIAIINLIIAIINLIIAAVTTLQSIWR